MENLNAETVKKALECCSADTTDCHSCPYSEFSEFNCFDNAKKDALALINSLEQRIKELEVELKAMRGAANSYKMHIVELTEENERLRKSRSILAPIRGFTADEIDQIAKEMLEGDNEN